MRSSSTTRKYWTGKSEAYQLHRNCSAIRWCAKGAAAALSDRFGLHWLLKPWGGFRAHFHSSMGISFRNTGPTDDSRQPGTG
jgi:hypothetical protein